MGIRTVTNGTDSYRFTPGQPDGLNTPVGGPVPGKPPFIWMTGGGQRANNNPAAVGFDRLLDKLTDEGGYTLAQPDVPWMLGNDTAMSRINDAIAWVRNPANGVHATNDPPLFLGFSNGWICASIWMLNNPITGVVGCLAPVDNKIIYETDYGGGRQAFEDAWGVTYPTPLPERASPYQNIANYPLEDFRDKIQIFYSCSDYIMAPQQMSWFTRMMAEQHNIGPIGHTGTWGSIWLGDTGPADLIDADAMLDFVNRCVAAL